MNGAPGQLHAFHPEFEIAGGDPPNLEKRTARAIALQLNFSQGHGDDTDIPSAASFGQNVSAVCPNCGYQIPLNGVQPVYFGDRILVLKRGALVREFAGEAVSKDRLLEAA